jgi:hypothetical protein
MVWTVNSEIRMEREKDPKIGGADHFDLISASCSFDFSLVVGETWAHERFCSCTRNDAAAEPPRTGTLAKRTAALSASLLPPANPAFHRRQILPTPRRCRPRSRRPRTLQCRRILSPLKTALTEEILVTECPVS